MKQQGFVAGWLRAGSRHQRRDDRGQRSLDSSLGLKPLDSAAV